MSRVEGQPDGRRRLDDIERRLSALERGGSYRALDIPAEESTTSTSYTTLATPDSVSVALPAQRMIAVGYNAEWKESVLSAARASVFLGGNQLRGRGGGFPETSIGIGAGTYQALGTQPTGLTCVDSLEDGSGTVVYNSPASPITTGQVVGGAVRFAGICFIHAPAGAYDVSIRYKASSGTVTVKERKLWVLTF